MNLCECYFGYEWLNVCGILLTVFGVWAGVLLLALVVDHT